MEPRIEQRENRLASFFFENEGPGMVEKNGGTFSLIVVLELEKLISRRISNGTLGSRWVSPCA